MKILELHAENIKRLRAVTITPDPTVQVISGRNAQGKSSVLDAIWLALAGGKASKAVPRPVRDGADHAAVALDLGDLKVTRTWDASGKSALRVEAADGARYNSPQAMLDRLVGGLSFDPLAFTRLSAREQREALLDLVDLDVDLDALDRERADLYAQRTDVGRQGKALGDVVVDENLPIEETSMLQVLEDLRLAQEHNAEVSAAARKLDHAEREADRARQALEEARRRLIRAEEEVAYAEAAVNEARREQSEAGERAETAPIEERMRTLEEDNAAIRANNEARARAAERDRLRGDYQDLTDQINAIDEAKAQALAAAAFPVEGLGFDDAGVTYRGIPFAQASSAEQIRVSVAMAMALNPELRVLRIMDGSLLDSDAMEAIRAQVADGDFQLWIERVGDADAGAVVIEDGQVAQQ
ncbi:MAG: AAA family ATPase [Actinomyces sp.]|uniref:AAA family ATPase n=1 Tax=Actinomyces sp. TaxID=29317 RepID=UPI0026DA7000|nr:AAA family ATPase [Actinomyces sp.]MDO4243564.1 AAA family ATPase [Actinomyces sp.]